MLLVARYIIYYASIFSPLPAIWFGRRKKCTLWYYVCACFFADAINYALKQTHIKHALVSNLFLLSEFLLVTSYFKHVFWGGKYKGAHITIVSTIAFLYAVNTYRISISANDDVQAYNYMDASFFYIMYIILALAGLYKVMNETALIRIERSPLFLSCVAFLLYASGAFFLLLFKDKATEKDMSLYNDLWIYFFMPLNITKNILLAYSLKNAARNFKS